MPINIRIKYFCFDSVRGGPGSNKNLNLRKIHVGNTQFRAEFLLDLLCHKTTMFQLEYSSHWDVAEKGHRPHLTVFE